MQLRSFMKRVTKCATELENLFHGVSLSASNWPAVFSGRVVRGVRALGAAPLSFQLLLQARLYLDVYFKDPERFHRGVVDAYNTATLSLGEIVTPPTLRRSADVGA